MKRRIIIAALIVVLVLLTSCQTVVSIPYIQPSNIDMSRYRNVAVASASKYDGYQVPSPYIRYVTSIFDPRIVEFDYLTSYNYDSVNQTTAKELTRMVEKVFSTSYYYSTISSEKADTYISLYKIGKNPSALLKADGVDALIVPKITSLYTDEYIDVDIVKDYRGVEKVEYTLWRTVDVRFNLTVLDTSTDRVIAVKEYHVSKSDHESFSPYNYVFHTIRSEQQLVADALSGAIGDIVDDFIPTRRYADVTLKDNNPKLQSVEEAYKAAENGNLDYALSLFRDAYNSLGHVPSGYNAALILASNGDIEGALSILSDIRTKGKDDSEVNHLYSRILSIKAKNEEAAKQLEEKTSSSSEPGISPYEYLM